MKNNNEQKKNKKKLIILILILILILLCIGSGLYYYYLNQNNNSNNNNPFNPNIDEQAVEWEGKQTLDQTGRETEDKISIPCFDGLVFQANQTSQKVNLYNPENNSCYMKFSIIVENKTIWTSEMVAPAKGFYKIELAEELEKGNYSGMVLCECFSLSDLSPMNCGSFHFNLTVR